MGLTTRKAVAILLTLLLPFSCLSACRELSEDTTDGIELPVPADEIVWAKEMPSSPSTDEQEQVVKYGGVHLMKSLYDAVCRAQDATYFAIIVSEKDITPDADFLYEGETFGECLVQMEELETLLLQLSQLDKVGDRLKYGEALYLEGTPDGDKWAKENYERTVAYFGEELISKYVGDGVFYRERLLCDLEEAERTLPIVKEKLEAMRHAHFVKRSREQFAWLKEHGYTAIMKGSLVFLFIKKTDLSTLDTVGEAELCLYHAMRSTYEEAYPLQN